MVLTKPYLSLNGKTSHGQNTAKTALALCSMLITFLKEIKDFKQGLSIPIAMEFYTISPSQTITVYRNVVGRKPIVTAHPYCARKFTCHAMHRARALSTKINNDRAGGHC